MADEESPFEPDPDAEFVWMIHNEGTVPGQFPVASVPMWQLRGWTPCEAPVEVDPALVEYVPRVNAAPESDKKSRKGVSKGVNEDA